MKKKFIALAVLAMGFTFAQTGKVGVNTVTPTETKDVNGTMRVRDLPEKDAKTAIYTTGNNTSGSTKTSDFKPSKTIVADDNGVLGYVNGLPLTGGSGNGIDFTASSGHKHWAGGAFTSNSSVVNSEDLILTNGCLQMIINNYYGWARTEIINANAAYIAFKLVDDAKCPNTTDFMYAEAGGQRNGGTYQNYQWDGNTVDGVGQLNKTSWRRMSGSNYYISDNVIRFGEIVLPNFIFDGKPATGATFKFSVYTRLISGGGTGENRVGGLLQGIY